MSKQYDPQVAIDLLEQGEEGLEDLFKGQVRCSKKWRCRIYLTSQQYCPGKRSECRYEGRIVGD